MHTIGLIDGMSWESAIPYYGIVNESVEQKFCDLRSAKVVRINFRAALTDWS